MCALLWRSIREYQRTTRRASMILPAATDDIVSRDLIGSPSNCTTSSYVVSTRDDNVVIPGSTSKQNNSKRNRNNNAANEVTSQLRKKRPLKRQESFKSSFRDRLNPRLYFALILSVIYIACSACFVAAIIIDSAIGPTSGIYGNLVFALSRITMWLYTTACPVVMVRNLPQLKISLYRLYTNVTSCRSKRSPKRQPLSKCATWHILANQIMSPSSCFRDGKIRKFSTQKVMKDIKSEPAPCFGLNSGEVPRVVVVTFIRAANPAVQNTCIDLVYMAEEVKNTINNLWFIRNASLVTCSVYRT